MTRSWSGGDLSEFHDYISIETLAVEIFFELPNDGVQPLYDEFEGEILSIKVTKRLSS